MNKLRIFPKSLRWKSQISKCVNQQTFYLYEWIYIYVHVYVNYLKTNPTLFKNVNRQR